MKKTILFLAVLYSSILMAQDGVNTKEIITPPAKVLEVFQKEYPNVTPVWSLEYLGHDNDEIRYEAKFNSTEGKALAIYDSQGFLTAFELSIPVSKLPKPALTYLKQYYPKSTIRESSVVVDYKKKTTYEVGIENDAKFYDVVFDKDGDFNVIIQKD